MMNQETEILDNNIFSEKRSKYKYFWSFLLSLICLLIWWLMYDAKDLPYDDNIGSIFLAMMISLICTLALVILFFKKREIFLKNIIAIIVFTITSSPISIFHVAVNYEFVFGSALAV